MNAIRLLNASHCSLIQKYIVRCIFEMPYKPMTTDFKWLLQSRSAEIEYHITILQGIIESMQGRKNPTLPAHWDDVYNQYLKTNNAKIIALAQHLAVILDDQSVIDELRAKAKNSNTEPGQRIIYLEMLLPQYGAISDADRLRLVNDPVTRPVVIQQLGGAMSDAISKRLITFYPKLTEVEQQDVIAAFTTRAASANLLLDAIEAQKIPREDVTMFTARQISTLGDKAVTARLEKIWGTIRPASATRLQQAERIRTMLGTNRDDLPNLQHGRALFVKNCASCHKLFDDGQAVGPDLTGSQRRNLDYILENVLDPSAVVPREYKMITFTLIDGRTINGIVTSETPHAKKVRTINAELIIPKADIDVEQQSNVSIMPDGLLDPLSDTDIRDLLKYLASSKQVPLPSPQ